MSRRTFLGAAAVAPFLTPFQNAPAPAGELTYLSLSAIAAGIRTKRFSSLEVVEAHLKRIVAVNPKLNALVTNAGDAAREEARRADAEMARGQRRGVLHGVPITIKDSFEVAGMRSTAGTPGWSSRVPAKDATVVARLRAAGCIILGKSNTPEFTMSDETDNPIFGRTNNPYDLSRTPGGSSGGAVALVAAGCSPLDLGTDTGNSIRMPSHFCGVAGIKPTAGRVPRTGHAISWAGHIESWTQVGPIARFVDDLILALPIISGPDNVDPHAVAATLGDPAKVMLRGLRVAFHVNNGLVTPTVETQRAVRAASEALRARGARVEEKIPAGLGDFADGWARVAFADGGAWYRRLLASAGTPLDARNGWVTGMRASSSSDMSLAIEQMDEWRSKMLGFFNDVDVILCPVHPTPAVPHGGSSSAEFSRGDYYSSAFNVTGWPAASVRAATSPEGLPIGVQVVGPPFREDTVLAVAKAIETDLGGWKKPAL